MERKKEINIQRKIERKKERKKERKREVDVGRKKKKIKQEEKGRMKYDEVIQLYKNQFTSVHHSY